MTSPLMGRLYKQLYLTIFAGIVLIVIAVAGLLKITGGRFEPHQILERAAALDARGVFSNNSDPDARRAFLEDIHALTGDPVALYGPGHELIDVVGAPEESDGRSNAQSTVHPKPVLAIRLSSGGWIEARASVLRPMLFRFGQLAIFALLIGACCYPVVRYLTRRLERLQQSVESLGSGDFSARVKVEGNDEVARLAESFNKSAEQIEGLVGAHKLLLANVSHEIRTPLARLRLTVELLRDVADPKRRSDLEKDIAEIDALMEQILLSSRLDVVKQLDVHEEVDLLALAAEEGARFSDTEVTGDAITIRGDSSLLRRMVRNLIENAQHHGIPPVEISVRRIADGATISVSDRGGGVQPEEQERVFAPFYRPRGARSRGSGLGLALVRQIARQHGGDAVWGGAELRPSTICVTLRGPTEV